MTPGSVEESGRRQGRWADPRGTRTTSTCGRPAKAGDPVLTTGDAGQFLLGARCANRISPSTMVIPPVAKYRRRKPARR